LRGILSSAFFRVQEGVASSDSVPGDSDMASRKDQAQDPKNQSNTIKDPDEWTTGEDPMTGAQESYLHTLATEAGEEVEPDLTKAEASKRIDELRQKTGKETGGR
jgi:hypothetical protein